MTNEQAKSELMQIYGSLSEEKKMALDVLMAQADGEYISKQVVLNTIDKWYEDKADIEDLIVKITYMPSVAIPTSPCDLCKYNPPSSSDGKPCTMCPAVKID